MMNLIRYRWQIPMAIGMAVLWVLFKINFLSFGWNIVVGLIITAVIFVVTGLVSEN